jgi:hypothetical protein
MRPAKPPGLDEFFAAMLTQLRGKGVPCAITGGLACVEFGVTDHTEDCDLICPTAHAETLFQTLRATPYGSSPCQYRKSSPPLDARWLAGGYSAHFHWPSVGPAKPFLDVFGAPPRVSTEWEKETVGLFAGRHTVAEMKRTRRRKDWDQATALGLGMLKNKDSRGWLHIFDATTLRELIKNNSPGKKERSQRPVLRLAQENSPLLDRAIQTEIEFWTHLDELRLRVYRNSLEPYALALLHGAKTGQNDLMAQHIARVQCAEKRLSKRPLQDYGVERLIEEASRATALGLDPAMLEYLPKTTPHFQNIPSIS